LNTPALLTPEVKRSGPAGLTILRFAHAYDSGGGTERYLDDLDRALLDRSAATVIRLHLTRETSPGSETVEALGLGQLIRLTLPVIASPGSASPANGESPRFRLKQWARDRVLYNSVVWRAAGEKWTSSHRLSPRPGEAIGAGSAAAKILRSRRIDLVVMHFFGGSDADEIIAEARKCRVPVALINHYSNDRFLHLANRKHVMLADGVAGVNGLDVPHYLKGRLQNVSDGIDTEFFRVEHARPLANPPTRPIILLPARVVREKGQMDLLGAAVSLRKAGLDFCIAFAGRVDASDFVTELRRKIADTQMTEYVRFLDNLSVEELRDWYAASAIVAFPTYHHEGLGRVSIEAQAMNVPVVAYATGGVPEGIISGKTGYLVPTGDIAALTRHLGELLASPGLRDSMARRGRGSVETHFSLPAVAERHERFYAQTILAFQARISARRQEAS